MYVCAQSPLSLTEVGAGLAAESIATACAKVGGGMVIEWLGRRDDRWFAWMPCLGQGTLALVWFLWYRLPLRDGASARLALRLLIPVGLLGGMQAAPQMAMAASLVPPRSRGLATAVFQAGPGLAGALTVPLVGALADATGRLAFSMALVTILTCVLGSLAYALAGLYVHAELAALRRQAVVEHKQDELM